MGTNALIQDLKLNDIRCDKLFIVVAAIRAHPDKYEDDFNTLVAFLAQYIDKLQVLRLSQSLRPDLPNGR